MRKLITRLNKAGILSKVSIQAVLATIYFTIINDFIYDFDFTSILIAYGVMVFIFLIEIVYELIYLKK